MLFHLTPLASDTEIKTAISRDSQKWEGAEYSIQLFPASPGHLYGSSVKAKQGWKTHYSEITDLGRQDPHEKSYL